MNERGMFNGGYADGENYSKPLNGHSTSGELTDEHEYQGLYTEVATPSSQEDRTILKTGGGGGGSDGECISPSSSIGENLKPNLSATGFETDSSDPYYTKLNDSDDQSPSLCVPGGGAVVAGIGKYNGSTSGDDSGDYEQLNLNRDDGAPRLRVDPHQDVDDETGEGPYGIMVEIEEQLQEGRHSDSPTNEEYDHLDRGHPGSVGHRPLG